MKVIKDEDFNIDSPKMVRYEVGGMWEELCYEVYHDCPVSEVEDNRCPHLGEKYIVRSTRRDGSTFDRIHANCPRVVVVMNEGGFNSTGVCLDCILDALGRK